LWGKASPNPSKRGEIERVLQKYQTARPSTYALLKELKKENKINSG
jgi:ATP-dependent DNA helicase RecG